MVMNMLLVLGFVWTLKTKQINCRCKVSWNSKKITMRRMLELVIVLAITLLNHPYAFSAFKTDTTGQQMPSRKTSSSVFPILMYDSDIGFGFGGKGVIKDQLKQGESFDLTIFGSTKGEQWYVFAFSIPDFEIRQGTAYPKALDLKLEFDKFLKSNFFGFGNNSPDNDWQFPREMTKLELTLGRAFTERIIGEIGLLFNHTSVYSYEGVNSILTSEVPGASEHLTTYFVAKLRRDTRDSQIHPHRGWKIGFNFDIASKSLGGDFSFQRYRLEVNKYQKLFTSAHVLAMRLWIQHVDGTAPYYEQSIIGGSWTTRGFKADRFIDRALTISSVEYRFPIYRKIGGVLFVDAGRVYPSIKKINLHGWKTDWGGGLRYYLANFVVRFDVGVSREGTRVFLNFGQVF